MGAKLCPEAQSPSVTNLLVNSSSQSGSGAVMTTSQTSCTAGLLQLGDQFPSLIFALGHAGPTCDDPPIVAEPDPSAGHAQALRMHDEIHGSFGADRPIVRRVPPHEDLVVPKTKLAAPEVAALFERPPSVERFDLDQFGPLAKANGLNSNVFYALSLRLPARVSVAGEVNSINNRPSVFLVEREPKGPTLLPYTTPLTSP